MACGCIQQSKERLSFENIKKLAKIYAKSENKIVFIYKNGEIGYNFIEIDCKEAEDFDPIEYIHPMC